jgi:hypothetical protein
MRNKTPLFFFVAFTFTKLSKFRKRVQCLGWQTLGLLFLLCWTACKKAELPPSSFDDPVFSVTYQSDSVSNQTVTAGVDDVYLFTDYSVGDSIVCSGSFSKVDCPDGDCPGSLTFEFRSPLTDDFRPDTVFHLGQYVFEGTGIATDTVFLTTFNVVPNSGYNTFSWDIDSVNVGVDATLVQEFQENVPKTVRLTAQKTSGLKSTVFRTISLTNPGLSSPSVEIDVQLDSFSMLFLLTAEISGTPADTILWNNGVTTDTFSTASLAGFYSVAVQDDFGNLTQARLEQLTPSDVPVQTAGFTYQVEPIIVSAPAGEVSIEWVDAQGAVWRSDWGAQSPGALFSVVESTTYEENENGQKTRKMQVVFDCLLFNGTGQGRVFSGTGVIAVAHP